MVGRTGGENDPSSEKGVVRVLFLGTYTPKLDDKGRLILPAKFRKKLEDGLVITRGQDRCLVVYAQDEFERIALQWQSTPTSSRAVRDYQRVFLSGASLRCSTPAKPDTAMNDLLVSLNGVELRSTANVSSPGETRNLAVAFPLRLLSGKPASQGGNESRS